MRMYEPSHMPEERVREERVQRARFAVGLALALLLHGAVMLSGLFELKDFARQMQQRHIDAEIQIAQEREPEPESEPQPEREPEPKRKPEPMLERGFTV